MICVECGVKLESESLYVEYSERNIKLIRCDKCSNVADKYIEYELLLVSIDLILLCEQAYRHMLFNRSLLNRPSFRIIPSLMASVLLVNLLLKMVVAEHWVEGRSEDYSHFYPVFLLTASVAEHMVFVGTVFLMLRGRWRAGACPPSGDSSTSNSASLSTTKDFHRKIYIALTFPEVAKLVTLLLQTWDSSPVLFLVAGLLCLGFQYVSLGVALSYFQQRRATGCAGVFLAALGAKVATRFCFHSFQEVLMMGVVL